MVEVEVLLRYMYIPVAEGRDIAEEDFKVLMVSVELFHLRVATLDVDAELVCAH